VLGWGRGRAGVGVPWRGRVASAWSSAPTRWLLGGARELDGEQYQVQERVEGALVGECGRWDPGLAAEALTGAGGRHCERQERRRVRSAWRGSVLKARGENVLAP
jgi:hypothetical protein